MLFRLLNMYKNLILIFLFIITLSCSKDDFDIQNLNGNKVSAFGHGGMGTRTTYPINSFESLMKCLYSGADGTELDVQMTKDSVLVAFHDRSLEHSTNISGQIFNKTWGEIKDVTYKNPLYTNYKIISLDELFTNIENPTKYIFFLFINFLYP